MFPLNLASLAQRAASRFGWELRRPPEATAGLSMAAGLRRLAERGVRVSTIIDVGAASGHWTELAIRSYPAARGLLLEPLEERRAELSALAAKRPSLDFVIAAAGAACGEIAMNVSSDLDGSGIYGRANSTSRQVQLTTIDHEIARLDLPAPFLIKLDTHGFEVPILAGAAETLRRTEALIIEAYNFRLSPQCLLFHELCAHLETLGFRCADIIDPLLRPVDRLLWQVDLVFLRANSSYFAQTQYQTR